MIRALHTQTKDRSADTPCVCSRFFQFAGGIRQARQIPDRKTLPPRRPLASNHRHGCPRLSACRKFPGTGSAPLFPRHFPKAETPRVFSFFRFSHNRRGKIPTGLWKTLWKLCKTPCLLDFRRVTPCGKLFRPRASSFSDKKPLSVFANAHLRVRLLPLAIFRYLCYTKARKRGDAYERIFHI